MMNMIAQNSHMKTYILYFRNHEKKSLDIMFYKMGSQELFSNRIITNIL